MTTTTPNMDLVIPDVSATLGPQWASILNTALERVDQHDHTSSNGVQVPTAGINVNADLPFNGYGISEVAQVALETLLSDPAPVQSVYSKDGNLYYLNSASFPVQITQGNSLFSTPGSIQGLEAPASGVYSDSTFTLSFFYDGAKQAKFDISTIQLHPYENGVQHDQYISLVAPTSMSGFYDITLPAAVPGQSGVLSMDTTGQIAHGLPVGSATTPSLYFSTDTNTGLYRSTSDELGVTSGGTAVSVFAPGQLKLVGGSAAAPSYTFIGDTVSGFFSRGAGGVGLTLNGTERAQLDAGAFVFKPGGSTEVLKVTSTQVQVTAGSQAAPAYSFSGDTDTGMYGPGGNLLAFSTGGTFRLTMSTSAITANIPVLADAGASSGSGGTVIKWRSVFVGNSAGTSGTLTVTSGIPTGSTIYGMVPVYKDNTTNVSISGIGTTSTLGAVYDAGSSNVSVQWSGLPVPTSNRRFSVIIFYI